MSLKHGDKTILELRFFTDDPWTKVRGKIVTCDGHRYFRHRNTQFDGRKPRNPVEGYSYWMIPISIHGEYWRFPGVQNKKEKGNTSVYNPARVMKCYYCGKDLDSGSGQYVGDECECGWECGTRATKRCRMDAPRDVVVFQQSSLRYRLGWACEHGLYRNSEMTG
jgi:ribosomal protein L24E